MTNKHSSKITIFDKNGELKQEKDLKWIGSHCLRCGMLKKDLRRPGYYVGCKVYGTYYGNHKYK